MSLASKGFSDSFYYLIANIGYKLLAFLIIPILAKSIGVEEFATYDLFLLISGFIDIFIVLGLDSGVSILLAEAGDDDEKLSFYYLSTLIISSIILLIISFILLIVFLFVNNLFMLDSDIWLYIILYVFFNMLTYHTFNFLRWRAKAREASFITLFSYVVGMLTGLVFLYLNSSIESYLRGLILGLSIGAIVSTYMAREYFCKFRLLDNYKELLKELFKISLPFVPNYLGNNLMQMADRIVILTILSKYELGLYAVVVKLAMIPQVLIGTVATGFAPVLLKNYKNSKGKRLIQNFFHAYLIIIPILFLLSYFLSDIAVELFAGKEYMKVAHLLPLALVSILFVQSAQSNGFGYVIKRKTYHIVYITFFTVALNYIFSLVLGYKLGLEGIILGTLLAGIIRTFIYTFYSEKLYSFDYNFKLLTVVSIISLILTVTEGVL